MLTLVASGETKQRISPAITRAIQQQSRDRAWFNWRWHVSRRMSTPDCPWPNTGDDLDSFRFEDLPGQVVCHALDTKNRASIGLYEQRPVLIRHWPFGLDVHFQRDFRQTPPKRHDQIATQLFRSAATFQLLERVQIHRAHIGCPYCSSCVRLGRAHVFLRLGGTIHDCQSSTGVRYDSALLRQCRSPTTMNVRVDSTVSIA